MNHVSHADTTITRTDLGPARWGTLSTTIASTTNNYPNGVKSISPGLPSPQGYLGCIWKDIINPNGVASGGRCGGDATPLGLGIIMGRVTQGSSSQVRLGPTLG